MTNFAWAALGLIVQVVVGLRFPRQVGRGRIFSRPLWRFRLFAPFVYLPFFEGMEPLIVASKTRLAQILCLSLLYIPAFVAFDAPLILTALYWTIIISWYGDDWLTGNDERWNRLLGWLKRWRAKRRALRHPSPSSA